MSVDVEQLYKSFGELADAKENAKQHPEAYKTILKGTKGNGSTKRLAAQFIARFFKHFPNEAEEAINSLLDLCEDEDAEIRKSAIKQIPNLCKADKQHLSRLADVLAQLLASDDESEVSVVNISLNGLFKLDAKGTLSGVFAQILGGDEDVREKAIKYLCSCLKSASESDMNKDTEEYVLAESKKIMEDVTGDEFQLIMQGLSSLHHLQTIQGRQQMVDIIAEQMNLEDDFKVSDPDSVNRISQCVGMAMPLCSRNVHASRFVNYLCQKVIPTLKKEEATNGEDSKEESPKDRKLELMKQLAEMSLFCGNGNNITESIEPLFEKLLEYMPLPPEDPESNGNIAANPKLQFSYVECLMFAFHQMGKHKADFLTSEEAAERLKDFRLRLQYFARGLQVYIKQLRASLHGKSPSQLRSEPENQIKIVALKTCNNVNTLIKDLFHNPPAYKATVQVSWKKPATATTVAKPEEPKARKRSITGGDDVELKKKTERTIYRAPEGKYSSNITQRGAFGGRGRGRGRGNRGGNRRWSGGKKF